MRVWDVSPGYLNRQSLLGEHRELHGVHAIFAQRAKGYSLHPETLRWTGALTGLGLRHAQLAAEMRLRGYADRTPLPVERRRPIWPDIFVTEPAEQIQLLHQKYSGRSGGRIPLPGTAQELWAQHKYSVLARDPETCRAIGRTVARSRRGAPMAPLARDLVLALRLSPSRAPLSNALEQMWCHVRRSPGAAEQRAFGGGLSALFATIQAVAVAQREPVLLSSTALSELSVFVADRPAD